MEIKDSGTRQQFDSGAVRDIQTFKGRCDLLPMDVICELYRIYESGSYVSPPMMDTNPFYQVLQSLSFIKIVDDKLVQDRSACLENLYNAACFFIVSEYNSIYDAILEVSIHFEEGALKYDERNWEKGIPIHCYYNSAVRHLLKYYRGDTDEPHNRAFLWNIVCLIWTIHYKNDIDLCNLHK